VIGALLNPLASRRSMVDATRSPASNRAAAKNREAQTRSRPGDTAFDLVTPEKLKDLNLSTPEALLNSGIFFLPLEPDIKTKYTSCWKR
jgi:hypothetical protein